MKSLFSWLATLAVILFGCGGLVKDGSSSSYIAQNMMKSSEYTANISTKTMCLLFADSSIVLGVCLSSVERSDTDLYQD
ncbi:MAG: hypothetical protein ACI4L7_02525 [Christensenellales bacterium]